jgi:predicted transcriptional regulator
MTPDGPPEDVPKLADEWQAQQEEESTRNRVYTTALQLYEPTRVKEIAEQADVSKETARDYLKWFVELGLLKQTAESPDMFQRNEQYFEWRRIQRLQTQSAEELLGQLEELTQQEKEYKERFGAESPAAVDSLNHGEYEDLETIWRELQEWQTVRRRIRELEQARQHRDEIDQAPA